MFPQNNLKTRFTHDQFGNLPSHECKHLYTTLMEITTFWKKGAPLPARLKNNVFAIHLLMQDGAFMAEPGVLVPRCSQNGPILQKWRLFFHLITFRNSKPGKRHQVL